MSYKYVNGPGLKRALENLKTILDPIFSVQTTTDTVTNVVEVPTSAKGLATLKRIGGMSYKVNQLLNAQERQVYTTNTIFTPTIAQGHKVLIAYRLDVLGSRTLFIESLQMSFQSIKVELATVGVWNYQVINADVSGTINVNQYQGEGTNTATICIYDLTAMGIDTTDVDVAKAELLKRGIYVNVYNEYNAGEIIDSKPVKVVAYGCNLFDYDSRIEGYELQQQNVVPNAEWYVMDYTPVQPNTTYTQSNVYNNYISLFDKNKNYLGRIIQATFTTPENCYFVRKDNKLSYTKPMLNKGSTALPYAPYSKHELAIPSEVRALEGYGWGVNENCYNYVDFTLKQYCKYVGRVDLGSLNFAKNENQYYVAFPLMKNYTLNQINNGNLIPIRYSTEWVNNCIQKDDNGNLYIISDDYATLQDFKTAMQGVYLYYELATPVITDVSSLLDEVHIPIEANGTLEPVNTYGNAVPVQVTFDNGLVDVVLTNHQHDIEQQKDIDFLLRGGNLKTINGQSLVGSGNISISADISHRYNIGLYDSSYTPIFIAFLTDAEQESYDPIPGKDTAISWIKAFWGKEQGNDIWYTTDVTNDAGYYQAGTGIVQTYEGLIGVVYDEGQGSGNETITAYFADGTTQQIALSDIGDTDQDNYFFRVF